MSLVAVDPPLVASVEAEAALCGALMQENRLIDQIADILIAEDFSEELHGRIYQAILAEHSKGRAVNVITLKPHFADDPSIAEVGGVGYLVTISTSVASVLGAKEFARQIRELAQRRRLIGGLREIITAAHRGDAEIDNLVSAAEQVLAETQHDTTEHVMEISASDALMSVLKQIEDGLPPGVTSGIDGFDRALGPIRPGDLDILAGRPGMGKTLAALSYAKGAAQQGHGVLFVSLEMSASQLVMRLAADLCFDGHSGINFSNIERGELSTEQFRRLYRAREAIADLPLVIVDLPSIRTGRLNSLVRRHKRRFAARGCDLKLVIVDYLQLIDAERVSDSRTSEITQISRGLKSCAKANEIGLLALAQLSRKVEEREEKRPRLADLRESGSIEQDADAVLFLYRHEYYLLQSEPPEGSDKRAKWDAAMQSCQGDIEFICAKRRQGETGIRHGRFYGAFQAVRG